MINLLFITNVFDDHLKYLINALKALDFNCTLHPLNNQKWPEEVIGCFDTVEPDFIQASNKSQLILITVDSKESIDSIMQLDINTHRNKLIIDISRNPLKIRNENEQTVRAFLKHHKSYVIARDDRQLLDPEGNLIPCETVISQDYLRFSYLPRPLIADIAWFLQKRYGNELVSQPPSTYIDDLISAPIGDEDCNILADKILKIDKYFSYALFRKELNSIISGDSIPQNLQNAASYDNFFWNSSLALLHHLPENSRIAKDLLKLKSHLTPKRPSNNGKTKKRILLFVVKKQRDLFIDLILRYWLEELGCEVIMRSLDDMPENSILELLPDAVIWGAKTTRYQMQLARFAADRNILSIVKREEPSSYRDWEKMVPTRKTWLLGLWDYSPLVDLELLFGKEFAEIISTFGYMPRAECKAVGAMSMDPYFIPNLDEVFPSKEVFCERIGISAHKKIMLFASRYCYADREDPETAIPEALGKQGLSADSAPEVNRIINLDKAGRKLWLDYIKQLYNNKNDEWEFILKVHPGEKADEYVEYFRENNLHIPVVLEGHMVEMLNYIDLLIHATSTTALEAHLLNIPSINLCDQEPDASPLVTLSPIAKSFDDLDILISNIDLKCSNANKNNVAKLENELYGKMDGKACQRAAQLIDQFIGSVNTKPFRYPNDSYKPGVMNTYNPYGQSASEVEVDHYYQKIKACYKNNMLDKVLQT